MARSGESQRLEMIRGILHGRSQLSPEASLFATLTVDASSGDDCAVYDIGDISLVVGMDFVRGTGFKLFQEGLLNYFDIGYYVIAANVSDIAAMGAAPIGLTTVVRYTDSLDDEDFAAIIRGMQAAAEVFHTPIIGGDIGGYDEVVLTATALGITKKGQYLTRKGAVPGDALCVTGPVGLPSTALVYFTKAKQLGLILDESDESMLLSSWKRPVAHVAEGIALSHSGLVHSCQDISDGTKATIDQLGAASNVSFQIVERSLPIHDVTRKVADFLGVDGTALALSASVDFQLMFTCPADGVDHLRMALSGIPTCDLSVIGTASSPPSPSRMLRDGAWIAIPGTAWNQQVGDVTRVILASANQAETTNG